MANDYQTSIDTNFETMEKAINTQLLWLGSYRLGLEGKYNLLKLNTVTYHLEIKELLLLIDDCDRQTYALKHSLTLMQQHWNDVRLHSDLAKFSSLVEAAVDNADYAKITKLFAPEPLADLVTQACSDVPNDVLDKEYHELFGKDEKEHDLDLHDQMLAVNPAAVPPPSGPSSYDALNDTKTQQDIDRLAAQQRKEEKQKKEDAAGLMKEAKTRDHTNDPSIDPAKHGENVYSVHYALKRQSMPNEAELAFRHSKIGFIRSILTFMWGGPIAWFFSIFCSFNPDVHFYKDHLEDVPISDQVAAIRRCTGARDGQMYLKKEHDLCFHSDGSSCEWWVPSKSTLAHFKPSDFLDAIVVAVSELQMENISRAFTIHLRAKRSWDPSYREVAVALENRGHIDDTTRKCMDMHQSAIYNYYWSVAKGLLYFALIPLYFFFPVMGICYAGYCAIDFFYHYQMKKLAVRYQNITTRVHEKALKFIAMTMIVVTSFSFIAYFVRWYQDKHKKKPSHDQGFATVTAVGGLFTSFAELFLHLLQEFGVEIPSEVGEKVKKHLLTIKLVNNVGHAYVHYQRANKYDQATMDDLDPMYRELFIGAQMHNDPKFKEWLKTSNEQSPTWLLYQEFYCKYWSWLDQHLADVESQSKATLETFSLFKEWQDLGEKEFNKLYLHIDDTFVCDFDAWRKAEIPVAQTEDADTFLVRLWMSTKDKWVDRKIPKQLMYIITGIVTLLIIGGGAYYYTQKKRKNAVVIQPPLLNEEGKKSLSSHRQANPRKQGPGKTLRSWNQDARDGGNSDQPYLGPHLGQLTRACQKVGRTFRLRGVPPVHSVGIKKPSELAGYEYVFLRVGDRGVEWKPRQDQYMQSKELKELFDKAKETGEKVFVILPVRESPDEPAHVYFQTGHQLQLENIEPEKAYTLMSDIMYRRYAGFSQGYYFEREALTFSAEQALLYSELGAPDKVYRPEENWSIVFQMLRYMGLAATTPPPFATYEALANYLEQHALNKVKEENALALTEESLVGGNIQELHKLGAAIFSIEYPGKSLGHGFVCGGFAHTCKHVLIDKLKGESKEDEIPKNRKFIFRTLDGVKIFEDTINIIVDGLSNDFVVFRFSKTPMLPSLVVSDAIQNGRDYDGLGFMLCSNLTETMKQRMSFGKVYGNQSVVTHYIPTVAGWSGGPIFDREGKVLGIHKGTLQVTNQGIPLALVKAYQNGGQPSPPSAEYKELNDQSLSVNEKLDFIQIFEEEAKRSEFTVADDWQSLIPLDIDFNAPYDPVIKWTASDGIEKTEILPTLRTYDYIGMARDVKYSERVTFKEDIVAKILEDEHTTQILQDIQFECDLENYRDEFWGEHSGVPVMPLMDFLDAFEKLTEFTPEGLRIWQDAYRPIHPDMRSCLRDIIKRDNVPEMNVNEIAWDIAWDICKDKWTRIQRMDEFWEPHTTYYTPVLPYGEVIQYTFDEDGYPTSVISPYLDLKQQPGYNKNTIFWNAEQCLRKMPEAMARRNELLFTHLMPEDQLIYFYQVQRKDELRDLERVLLNKGRAYYPEDLDFKILGMQLWHFQAEKLKDAPFYMKDTFFGETIFYGNWHCITNWLAELPFQNDWDVICWDGSLRERILKLIRDWRKTHIMPMFHTAADNYYSKVMRSAIVLPNGMILRRKTGYGDQKSGGQNTLDDNGYANDFCITYSQVRFLLEKGMTYTQIKSEIRAHFRHMVLGDDGRCTTIHDDFDQAFIRKCYLELGFALDPKEERHTHFTTEPFCGFKTKKFGSFYLPMLDAARICDATRYKKDMSPVAVIGKLESLFRLAAPDPINASKVYLYTRRYVEHVLKDPKCAHLLKNEAEKIEFEKRWNGFCSYEDAILMYFPQDENKQDGFSDNELAALYDPEFEPEHAFDEFIEWRLSKDEILDKMCREYHACFFDQCTTKNMHYGKFCGPNWSDGKQQPSVANGSAQPVDALDSACEKHDAAFANAASKFDLRVADNDFVKNASKAGPHGSLIARATRQYNKFTNYQDYPLPQRERKQKLRSALSDSVKNKIDSRSKQLLETVHTAEKHDLPNNNKKRKREEMVKVVKITQKAQKKFTRRQRKGRRPKRNGRRNRRAGPKRQRSFAPVAVTHNLRMGAKKQRSRQKKNGMTVSGEILLANLTIPSNVSVGDNLLSFQIAPQSFVGTELQVYSKMYEKYKFKKCQIHYRPSCPTTSNGQLVSFIDPDPKDTYATGTQGIRAAQNIQGSSTVAVYSPGVTSMAEKKYGFYWTEDNGSEDLLVYQGKFVVQANMTISSGTAFQAGSYYMNYVVQFYDRHNQWSSISSAVGAQMSASSTSVAFTSLSTSVYNSFDVAATPSTSGSITFKGFCVGDNVLMVAALVISGGTLSVNPTFTTNGFTSNGGLTAGYSNAALTQYVLYKQGVVTNADGSFQFTVATAPTFTGTGVWYIICCPVPFNLSTLALPSPVSTSQQRKFDQLFEQKFAQMKLREEEDRARARSREGLPKEVSLTDSEIETFQAIEKLEQKRDRSFSPSRLALNLTPRG